MSKENLSQRTTAPLSCDKFTLKIPFFLTEYCYNLRTGSERIFSRLLSVCMQRPSIKGLMAITNYCTIAHITVLLVALTAVITGNKDKIRFIKTLLPNL